MDSSDLSDGAITLQEYLEVKKALAVSEAKVQQLMKVNNSLSDELRRLQREIHKLQSENLQIRQQAGPVHPAAPTPTERPEHGHVPSAVTGAHRRDRHAFSMYEPGASPLKPFSQPPMDDLVSRLQPFHPGESEEDGMYSAHSQPNIYRIRKGGSISAMPFPPSSSLVVGPPEGSGRHLNQRQSYQPVRCMDGKRFLDLGKEEDLHLEPELLEGDLDGGLPSTEDVILKTEQVTKNIQELLRAAQEFKHDSDRHKYESIAERLDNVIPGDAAMKPALETVRSSLRLLNASAYRLQSECRKTVPPEPGAPVDYQLLTQQVIQCAYDIAKAAKQLVTITTREKKQ
ncbi:PREDICTED: ARF GTPase-activating protein GIT1-like [Thamnophis sirtalis]|uniref:ARF GTPase-activating protein GIT1-like n=1 Tax=Thamnophis sirtalis TaxID=35019 RepID=A0A6I9XWW5_9SAUR|nr:PREDICTED: ARF GTPase-activating protein GIT1-like [Thamnophis sirtalis]